LTTAYAQEEHIQGNIKNIYSIYYIPYFLLRYDGGPDAEDVPTNLPPSQFQDLIVNFYRGNIMITADKMKEIQLLTSKQGDSKAASAIWKSERRLHITSSNVKMIAQWR